MRMRGVVLTAVFVGLLGYTSWVTLASDVRLRPYLLGLRAGTWGGQILVDLAIALGLVCTWVAQDARRRAVPAWPWVLATAAVGSLSPLLYLVFRERRGRVNDRATRAAADREAADREPGSGPAAGARQETVPARLTCAIVHVGDMRRAVAFYRDQLGLPLKFESSQWTEFATGPTTLALHAGEAASETAGPSVVAGHCRPGLRVPDLDAFHARVVRQGVPCMRLPQETFGVRMAQYRDPDGLTISVSEERRNAC
jgi:predicted enzyme related to lactoylglutathione lyase